jgi:hypothetical protein
MNSGFYVPFQCLMFIVNSGQNRAFLVRQNMAPGQALKYWIGKPTRICPELINCLGEGPDRARGETGGGHPGGREAAQH